MSSASFKPTGAAPKQAPAPSSNTNPLLEKVNARTSTPDSEALASSDDEAPDHRIPGAAAVGGGGAGPDGTSSSSVIGPPAHTSQHNKPMRRSSWLNDTSSTFARPRKSSIASGSMSPTASNPSTPSAETTTAPSSTSAASTWGAPSSLHAASSSLGRAPGGPAFSWGTGIWNTTERKDPPQRLSEVLPSPTSTVPSSGSMFGPDLTGQTSPTSSNSQIPFAIPLHPTPKTYRSQSYSVGQMESDLGPAGPPPSVSASGSAGVRGAGAAPRHPGLQHRPSRPSMLSEMANDGSMLGKVKEVDDDADGFDDDNGPESMHSSYHRSSESKTIEMLARENAILRQQQYNRMRPRASTGASYFNAAGTNGYSLHESVPEESDYAVDELDELNDGGIGFGGSGPRAGAAGRRLSEYAGPQFRSPFGGDGARKTDSTSNNLKKALWSTPGLPVGDGSQSRRHSFANMPTRQGSISSAVNDAGLDPIASPDGHQLQHQSQLHDYLPSSYADPSSMSQQSFMSPGSQQSFHNPFQPQYGQPQQQQQHQHPQAHHHHHRPPSPHRSLYAMGQPRHNQLLHVVLFKCARADVFYIQEGTGLTVKPGDLVIVEADRGTDLGTVAKDNVDWQTAKELKEHYAEEHYKWLMMYSQGAAASTQDGPGAGLLASSSGSGAGLLQGSAIGGMGPPAAAAAAAAAAAGHAPHHLQEPNAGELRPKLIKRLAQSHEIHSLRDKEGQEAKAKRVCMQKVKEHGLNMEILDAEFQMDWKKLTFYYFADAYINFNSLVTDLFKIYKTRIWMSAINPASFASPTLGIQAPSGVGPGAVGANRAGGGGDRRQQQAQTHHHQDQQQQQQQQQQAFGMGVGGPPAAPRGFRPSPGPGPQAQAQGYGGVPNYGYVQGGGGGGVFGGGVRPGVGSPFGLAHAGVGAMGMGSPGAGLDGGFAAGGIQPLGGYQVQRQRFGSPQSPNPHGQMGMSPQGDWAAFQGLSLNSN